MDRDVPTVPPTRIELEADLVLEQYRPDMLPALAAAHASSVEHLAPFMPWARNDPVINAAEFFALTQQRRHTGAAWEYALLQPSTGDILGGMGLMTRQGPRTMEVGYWLRQSATGRGLATRGTQALIDVAFALPGIDTVYLLCDEANIRSAAVARRLGFELLGIEDASKLAPGQTGRMMRWALTRERHARRSGG
jgi:RimJ/RimL family protein N-acetyltransferase